MKIHSLQALAAAFALAFTPGPLASGHGGGGYPDYLLPTADQEKTILSIWGRLVPSPPFDFAYSWGSQNGDTSLSSAADLLQVFEIHNKK